MEEVEATDTLATLRALIHWFAGQFPTLPSLLGTDGDLVRGLGVYIGTSTDGLGEFRPRIDSSLEGVIEVTIVGLVAA